MFTEELDLIPNHDDSLLNDASEQVRIGVVNSAYEFMQPSTLREIVCKIVRVAPQRGQNWTEFPNVADEVERLVLQCDDKRVFKIIEAIYRSLKSEIDEVPFGIQDVVTKSQKFEELMNECFEEEGVNLYLSEGILKSNAESQKPILRNKSSVNSNAEDQSRSEAGISVFIGSSVEGIKIAQQVQYELQHVASPVIWNQGVFGLGRTIIESLMNELDKHDFAILILSPDDLINSRAGQSYSPRDNVIFELGLFMGRIGPQRTFVFYDKSSNLKLLSDLSGVVMAPYDGEKAKITPGPTIGTACHPIRQAIDSVGTRPRA